MHKSYLFIHPFVYLFVYSVSQLFIYLFVHLFNHLFPVSFTGEKDECNHTIAGASRVKGFDDIKFCLPIFLSIY